MSYQLAREIHQVLSPEGQIVGELPSLPDATLLQMYRWLVLGRLFSDRMVALQRQGRMGTFAPLNGQEGASVGLAMPMESADWLVASYRELISYFIKGVPIAKMMASFRGQTLDVYPKHVNCLPIQIVLGAQMPHAVGVAMGLKYDRQPNAVVAVCGDGATSEGDVSEAFNFAAVFKAPVVFVIQNNGWAISVPRAKQSAAEYLAHRAPGFGLPGYLVDGNDVLAVYKVVSECLTNARAGQGPSLVEALTYRLGPHTTADDPTKYRGDVELSAWQRRDPIVRFRKFLFDRGLLDDEADAKLRVGAADEIQGCVDQIDASPPFAPDTLFDHVYAQPTPQMLEQRRALEL